MNTVDLLAIAAVVASGGTIAVTQQDDLEQYAHVQNLQTDVRIAADEVMLAQSYTGDALFTAETVSSALAAAPHSEGAELTATIVDAGAGFIIHADNADVGDYTIYFTSVGATPGVHTEPAAGL